MSRIITSISFDLKFEVLSTPPTISVGFTGVAPGGHEHPGGHVSLVDAEARDVWDRIAKGEGMLNVVNAVLDARALVVAEPGSITARITAADEAETRRKNAEAAKAALDAQVADIDAALTAKRAELAALSTATLEPVATR